MNRVLTFFNNKGGVGKTSLAYHIAWMLSELDRSVLVVDLDPQANLTAAFLDEGTLEELWSDRAPESGNTIYRCVEPLTKVGAVREPRLRQFSERLSLLPGDLRLSGFEEILSTAWPRCLGGAQPYRPFLETTAFWQAVQAGAKTADAEVVLVDVGPSLGAINRAALISTDFVVVPLGADLFSRQGLRNLGPALRQWRQDWATRKEHWPRPEFALPAGAMKPIGYLVQQHSVRLSRPVKAYDRWVKQMPAEYAKSVLEDEPRPSVGVDPNSIATVKHYRSLVPLAQDARKPIFKLTAADGALGGHAAAASRAYWDFREIAEELLRRMGL